MLSRVPSQFEIDAKSRRVRIVYSNNSFREKFTAYLADPIQFEFTDEQRLSVLDLMKCHNALSLGQPLPDDTSSSDSECGEDPKNVNVDERLRLFVTLVNDHILTVFPRLEQLMRLKIPTYSMVMEASDLATRAGVKRATRKLWGLK